MKEQDHFLLEIHTEELPPKRLLTLAKALAEQVKIRLEKAELGFSEVRYYATPRRLAVFVRDLIASAPDRVVERKGPALAAAFDASGKPTQACIGFARSCGVAPNDLQTIKSAQGEWMGYTQSVAGKPTGEMLPAIVEEAIAALPIPKRMRWGAGEVQFVRPVHSIMMLYGDRVIDTTMLGCRTWRVTQGHRFMAPSWITIPNANDYPMFMQKEGYVIVDFAIRREMIWNKAAEAVKGLLGDYGSVYVSSDDFLNEVTGLVEWPVALLGTFDDAFLDIPSEVLVSSMQDHQRYFPVVDKQNKLLPYFVVISNIESKDPARVIHGNERVLRARLSDAAFFYESDKKEALIDRVARLKPIVYQAKLGTLYEKTERVRKLATAIAKKLKASSAHADRAALLAKTDLTTSMVGEFPELQGVMGYYYAVNDGESDAVAIALREQYLPRFAGDVLPETDIGQALAMADRLDTLVGAFGINQVPTGDKDPFGLRRAALGMLRTLIEKQINLDLQPLIALAIKGYKKKLENKTLESQLLCFLQDRLRSYYQDQGISADVFAAVSALGITNPLDAHHRIHAVQAFKTREEAGTLSIANKRVSNILDKYADTVHTKTINPKYFEYEEEKKLAALLDAHIKTITRLSKSGKYNEALLKLASLHQPIDNFFDQVMVMTEDKHRRENRILLLTKLRALFLQVADIALLQ